MSSYYAPLRGGGASLGTVFLQGESYSHMVFHPANASCDYSLTTAGQVNGTGALSYDWLIGGSASDYEVRADIVSGSLSSGTTGSWLPLSSSRFWNLTRTVIGSINCQMTVRIRHAVSTVELASCSVLLTATVEL